MESKKFNLKLSIDFFPHCKFSHFFSINSIRFDYKIILANQSNFKQSKFFLLKSEFFIL